MEKIIHMPSIAFYLRKRGFPILNQSAKNSPNL